jgi:cytochrome c2
MTDTNTDGLWRWLVGGLAAGAAILGLLIAAYAIGHHRGANSRSSAKPATTTAQAATTATTTTTTAGLGPVTPTPALVAQGKQLYSSDGCAACHSLTGAAGAGPTLKGVAGATSELASGGTVIADDAYLERSITDPDAEIVKGYQPGIMSTAIAGHDLATKPDDVRALVAYIKSQK